MFISIFIPLWLENILGMPCVLKFMKTWFFVLSYGLSWWMLCMYFRRLYTLLLLDGVVYKCMLYQVHEQHFLVDFCLVDLFIAKLGYQSPLLLLLSISPFKSVCIPLIYLCTPLLIHVFLGLLYLLDELSSLIIFYWPICRLKSILSDKCSCSPFGLHFHEISFSITLKCPESWSEPLVDMR